MHSFMASTSASATTSPSIQNTMVPGTPYVAGATAELYVNPPGSGKPLIPHPMAPGACGMTGQNQSHSNLMPSLCITFVICIAGTFPSRN
jgi:microcystin-dependent protein